MRDSGAVWEAGGALQHSTAQERSDLSVYKSCQFDPVIAYGSTTRKTSVPSAGSGDSAVM